MDVYTLTHDANRYAALLTVDEADLDRLAAFDGTPRLMGWRPVALRWETEDGTRPQSDLAVAGAVPVLSERGLANLADLITGRAEALPLQVDGDEPMYAFNVLRLSDALDAERTEFKRFSSSDRIMRIVHHEFDPEAARSETVFRLAAFPRDVYVTDAFRRRVEDAGLTGFLFEEPVWGDVPAAPAP